MRRHRTGPGRVRKMDKAFKEVTNILETKEKDDRKAAKEEKETVREA